LALSAGLMSGLSSNVVIIKCGHLLLPINVMACYLVVSKLPSGVAVLKGQCHEIFDLWFFRQSITPRPQMNTLKYFRVLFQIR
jgi:hypothetical protein